MQSREAGISRRAQDKLSAITAPAAAGNVLLSPLYVAAKANVCPVATADWIVDKLTNLGNVIGIRQALTLVNVLLKKQEQEVLDLAREFRMGRNAQGERRDAGGAGD